MWARPARVWTRKNACTSWSCCHGASRHASMRIYACIEGSGVREGGLLLRQCLEASRPMRSCSKGMQKGGLLCRGCGNVSMDAYVAACPSTSACKPSKRLGMDWHLYVLLLSSLLQGNILYSPCTHTRPPTHARRPTHFTGGGIPSFAGTSAGGAALIPQRSLVGGAYPCTRARAHACAHAAAGTATASAATATAAAAEAPAACGGPCTWAARGQAASSSKACWGCGCGGVGRAWRSIVPAMEDRL